MVLQLTVVIGTLALATLAGVLLKVRGGKVREVTDAAHLDGADIGAPLGDRATLVQFSSAFCTQCRATRAVLREVSGMVSGVTHVEVDAEAHLDLVRRLNILKTPTVLVLDEAGHIVARAAGLPRKPELIAAIGRAVS